MKEPAFNLNLSETELELILLFMKIGLVLRESLELDLGLPEEEDESKYINLASKLYDKLTDIAKFEFLVRRIDEELD